MMIICSVTVAASSQTRVIDSLRQNFYRSKGNEQRLQALVDLFEEYQSLNRDSMDIYAPVLKELGDKSGNARNKSLATLAYANWYYRYGWTDSALFFIEPEFRNNKVTDSKNRDIYFKLSRAKAIYYGSKSKYEQALEVLYKIVPEAERYNDTLNTGLASNTIGSIAIAREQYAEARQWVNKAINLSGNNYRWISIQAPALLNKANVYTSLGKTDSALYILQKALPLCRRLQNLNYVATALRLQANAYTTEKRYKDAEKSLTEMMAVRREITPANNTSEDNLQLADFYANSGQLDKAIEICKRNLAQGDMNVRDTSNNGVLANDPRIRSSFLQALVNYYRRAGRMDEYQATIEELMIAKDSLYASNSAQAIAELQTRYEVQMKENTILQQKYGLQRKNFILYGYIGLSGILLATGIFLFLNYRKKQRIKEKFMLEEEKRIAKDAVREAGERERVRIASDLHDNLGAYAASMASNLNYIHLQDADASTKNALQQLDANSNSIISELNDTIWVLKKDTLTLIAISDRIKTFIKRIGKSYPGTQIEVEENITIDHRLSSAHAFHLYRILQEGINNALKHSKGENIWVRFVAGDNSWNVSIEDNGVGIEPGHEKGNGLQNMRKRSHETGWGIDWKSTIGAGTRIDIHATTN